MVGYVMYKGEDLLHIGTIGEIAKRRGVLKETIYFYTTNAYRNKLAKRKKSRNYITVTRLED